MKGLELFAGLVGLAAALVFLLAVLRTIGELMHEWAGEKDAEPAPPLADHPYAPNGGPRGAAATFPAPAAYPSTTLAAPCLNATLPGRRKDNAHDRIEESSTR